MRISEIAVATVILTMTMDGSLADSPERRALHLVCPSAVAPLTPRTTGDLCRQVVQALAERTPRAAYRQVRSDSGALQDGVTVDLDLADGEGVLRWRTGADGALRSGRAVAFDGGALAADAATRRRYAVDLVSGTDGLTEAIADFTRTSKTGD